MDNTSLYKKPEELIPPASGQPENHQHEYEVKPGKRPLFWWGIIAVVVLAVVLIAATILSGWLTTSVIGPRGPA